jgi:hypothetical protein
MAAPVKGIVPRGGVYAIPTDPSTDRTNLVGLESVGLARRDPQTGQVLDGAAELATHPLGLQTRPGVTLTPAGRPGFARTGNLTTVVEPRLDRVSLPAIAPGTIRRNVDWPIEGGGGRGLFSSTANEGGGGPGRAFQVTAVSEYFLSTLRMMLPRSLSWVVTGAKPLIPEGPDGQHYHSELAAASGWPVVQPVVPSYASRVPLLRPRSLVSQT